MSIAAWLTIALLLAANALYVAAEFAAVGVRHSRLRERASQGSRIAGRVLGVVQDTKRLDQYIATCQVGITFSSLVLGAFGQLALSPPLAPLVGRVFDLESTAALSTAALIVLALLTALQVLLGELVPKSLALQFPTRTSLATFHAVHASSRLLAPFIWLLNGSAMALLRAFRLPVGTHRHIHSPEEIEMLVGESREGGLLEPEEHTRLVAALRLREVPARRLMVPISQVVSLSAGSRLEDVVQGVGASSFTRIPVHEGPPTRIIGFLHAKDIFLEGRRSQGIQGLLRPIPRVAPDMPGDRLLGVLREQRTHIAVVELDGEAKGIVTYEDVLAEMLASPTGSGPMQGGARHG